MNDHDQGKAGQPCNCQKKRKNQPWGRILRIPYQIHGQQGMMTGNGLLIYSS